MSIYSNIASPYTTYYTPKAILSQRNIGNITNINQTVLSGTSIFVEDISKILYYKAYNIDGTLKKYNSKDIICYRDKLFIAIQNTTNSPSVFSKEWKEVTDVISRYDISNSIPQGLKRPGDKWFNPTTSLIYIYTKNMNQYVWLSD